MYHDKGNKLSQPNSCLNMKGIITVLNTPFSVSGAIDHDAFSVHIEYALNAGVAGFLAPAMAGESEKLTYEECIDLTQTLLTTVHGRVPVIGCATRHPSTIRASMTEQLTQMGCDGILVSIPFTEEKLFMSHVHEVARMQPGFLMLQDWDTSGYGIPIEVIRRLFEEIPVFKCIKIEVPDAGKKYTETLTATNGKLHVSGGWAVTQMIEGLDRGIHAFMPTSLHHTYAAIYKQYNEGDKESAQRLFYRLAPILAFSNQRLEISIHFFKRMLHRQGIYPTPNLRDPEYLLDSYQEKIAEKLIDLA
ncbi:MAG: dihydrodipicolinate synthase family protein, partial [Candidatus Hydrogenedentes bacterium]|nr:dihydrodipicolinate synthase family protein [Candidatus Hydrogenedentota bacterium]